MLLPSGEYAISRALTPVNFREMKQSGDIKEFYSIKGKETTYHVAFENITGSEKAAKRVAIHVHRQRFGEPKPEPKKEPKDFVKQEELPFEILRAGNDETSE